MSVARPAAPADVGVYTRPAASPAVLPAAECAECGAALVGPYCAQCGQRAPGPDDLTLGRFARAAAEEVSGTDARLVASLWALVRSPGRLTREFVDGHRRRWASPVQLFLLASAAYFFVGMPLSMRATTARADLVAQLAQQIRKSAATHPDLARRATPALLGSDAVFDGWAELLGWGKFASLAAFALVAWVLHRRRVRGGVAPLTFALHYYAFDFLFFTATAPLLLLAERLRGAPLPQAAALPLVLVDLAYLYLALRRVYAERPARAALKAAALGATDVVATGVASMVALGVVLGRVLAGLK